MPCARIYRSLLLWKYVSFATEIPVGHRVHGELPLVPIEPALQVHGPEALHVEISSAGEQHIQGNRLRGGKMRCATAQGMVLEPE